ncbi:hypothetical protein SK128_000734, partial [Halocaridina rubra]
KKYKAVAPLKFSMAPRLRTAALDIRRLRSSRPWAMQMTRDMLPRRTPGRHLEVRLISEGLGCKLSGLALVNFERSSSKTIVYDLIGLTSFPGDKSLDKADNVY